MLIEVGNGVDTRGTSMVDVNVDFFGVDVVISIDIAVGVVVCVGFDFRVGIAIDIGVVRIDSCTAV